MGKKRAAPPAARTGHQVRAQEDPSRPLTRPYVGHRPMLLALCLVAALIRMALPYPHVFQPSFVNFQDPDAWYHMRLVDALVASFPHRVTIDPYARSEGLFVPIGPLFDYVVAGTALVVGLGSPTPSQVDTVAALVPPVLGALIVLPVYWFGRRAFDPLAGLIAAAIIAVAPGPLLRRTKLGFVDHHVAEVLLVASTAAFLLAALEARPDERRRPSRRAWGFIGLAGVAWGAYLLAWTSAALFAAVICAWALLQGLLDSFQHRGSGDLLQVVGASAAIAALVLVLGETPSAPRYVMRLASLGGTVGVLMAMAGVGRFLVGAGSRPSVLAAALAVVLLGLGAAVFVLAPDLVSAFQVEAGRLLPGSSPYQVIEAQPLFRPPGGGTGWSLATPWNAFGPSFFIGVPALLVLGRHVVRQRRPGALLVFVLSLGMFAATIGQGRFGYYLVVGLALLTGWACAAFIRRVEYLRPSAPRVQRLRRTCATAIVLGVVVFPTALLAVAVVQEDGGMPLPWHDALRWLRTDTPEPFSSPTVYVAPNRPGAPPEVPQYTVANWWDSGYWIVRAARRVPLAIPTQSGATDVARFLTSSDAAWARQWLDERRSRYVVLSDDLIQMPRAPGISGGKFGQLATVAGAPPGIFFDAFFKPGDAGPPAILFRPAYFQAVATRLLAFGGRAEQPELAYVVSWVEQRRPTGEPYNLLTSWRAFTTFAEAQAFLASLGPGNHDIVSDDPLKTCVPVEALPEYRLVYESPDGAQRPTGRGSVRVFEVVR